MTYRFKDIKIKSTREQFFCGIKFLVFACHLPFDRQAQKIQRIASLIRIKIIFLYV